LACAERPDVTGLPWLALPMGSAGGRGNSTGQMADQRAGQADPGATPPHAYIPAGPVEAAPYLGYCPPEVRQEAFAAVLDGVGTGAYDRRIVAWLTGWDDTTCRTIASLMWRCRPAGGAEARKRPQWHS